MYVNRPNATEHTRGQSALQNKNETSHTHARTRQWLAAFVRAARQPRPAHVPRRRGATPPVHNNFFETIFEVNARKYKTCCKIYALPHCKSVNQKFKLTFKHIHTETHTEVHSDGPFACVAARWCAHESTSRHKSFRVFSVIRWHCVERQWKPHTAPSHSTAPGARLATQLLCL